MKQLAMQLSYTPLTPRGLNARPVRRQRPIFTVYADGKNGIHDPAGPIGSWGAGDANARKERLAQEESFRVGKEDLTKNDIRSDQKKGKHIPGHAAIDRPAVVSKELEEMAEEKADEDYEHMSEVKKKSMELKNVLYNFLKTGYEPL
jgi:hypothetical protein